jgi:hypothetical protein
MNDTGMAAADELDALNTKDDFEPTVEVDIDMLEATIEALDTARELVARLEALKKHLDAAGAADQAEGLAVEVALTVETLAAQTAAGIA